MCGGVGRRVEGVMARVVNTGVSGELRAHTYTCSTHIINAEKLL